MNFTKTLIALAVTSLALPAIAQSSKEMDELRQELRQLRKELNDLKAQKAAPAKSADGTNWGERIEQVELKQKDAVVAGDTANSFRIPGSESSMRIYGFAEVNMVTEFAGDNSNNDYSTFVPYAPINDSTDRKGQTYLHARTSRLGFETSTPTTYGPLSVKVEGDFNNEPRYGNSSTYGKDGNIYTQAATNSYGFRLRHAYGQFGGLLVGQTWTTFMDLDNSPETVDYNGPIGSTFIRQSQIRYAYGTKDLGTFTGALENPVSYVLGKNGAVKTSGFSKMPDVVLRWDKGFGWGSMSVRALGQDIRLNSADAAEKTSKFGYGLASTAFIKLRDAKDFLSLAVTYGDGIGRYFNYVEGAIYDDVKNSIYTEKALGIVGGYQYKASDVLRMNFVLGMQRNFDNDYTNFVNANGLGYSKTVIDSDGNTMGQFAINRGAYQGHVGMIYNPIKGVDLGAELIFGKRQTMAGEQGDLSRVNLSAKYYIN